MLSVNFPLKNFSQNNLHIFGTPMELDGTLSETVYKKNTMPSKFFNLLMK
jgi:hypothetical protein